MSRRKLAWPILLTLVCSTQAFAQHHADAPATTVQLPTFSFFTVSTSVLVPDRGSASLGGVNAVSNGSTAFGPSFPGNRAFGARTSAGGMTVHATIHDFESMDEALLRQAGMSNAQIDAVRLGRSPSDSAGNSVADTRRQQVVSGDKQQQEAADYFRKGQTAEAEGKANVAKIFYQMAARRASGELKAEMQRRLDGPALARSPLPPAKR